MTDLITWNEVEEQLEGECTVLLGNGFSISYSNSSFNQKAYFRVCHHYKD